MKLIKSKLLDLSALSALVLEWQTNGEKVVFTNGVFDLIHQGHIAYLADAAALGTKLVIGLNADDSVKTLAKGPARPIKDEESRAIILAAMQFVDAVVIFEENTPLNLINTLKPNILVKGGDYDAAETNPENKKYIVGREVVLAQDGDVKVIPFLEGFSTTALEQKIIELNKL